MMSYKIDQFLYDSLSEDAKKLVDSLLPYAAVERIRMSKKGNLLAEIDGGEFLIMRSNGKICGLPGFNRSEIDDGNYDLDISKLPFADLIENYDVYPVSGKKLVVEIKYKEHPDLEITCFARGSRKNRESLLRKIMEETAVRTKSDRLPKKIAKFFHNDLKEHGFTKRVLSKTYPGISEAEMKKAKDFLENPGELTGHLEDDNIVFNAGGSTYQYDYRTKKLSSKFEFRKKLELGEKVKKELEDIEKICKESKDFSFIRFDSITQKNKMLKFFLNIENESVHMIMPRPVTKEALLKEVENKKEIIAARKEEERKELEEIRASGIFGDYAYKTMISLIKRNKEHITENSLIQIMRNLSISSEWHYTYDKKDRVYSSITPERLADMLRVLIRLGIVRERYVAGKYQDYYILVPGSRIDIYNKNKDDLPDDCDENFSLESVSWENFLRLMKHPAVLCAKADECRQFLRKLDQDILGRYIDIKKKLEKDDKDLVYTLKQVEKLTS